MAYPEIFKYKMRAVNILQRTNQDKLKHVHQPIRVGGVQVQLEFFFFVACSSVHHLTHPCIVNMKAIIYYPYTASTNCLLFEFVASSYFFEPSIQHDLIVHCQSTKKGEKNLPR
jgi:hypothetical protein